MISIWDHFSNHAKCVGPEYSFATSLIRRAFAQHGSIIDHEELEDYCQSIASWYLCSIGEVQHSEVQKCLHIMNHNSGFIIGIT